MKKRVYYKLGYLIALLLMAVFVIFFWRENLQPERPYFCDDATVMCDLSNARYHDSSLTIEERVEDLLSHMTLDEKIGQVALVEKNSIKNKDDIARFNLGALLSGFGAYPEDNTPRGWQEMIADFQSYTKKTRLQIPLLYGVDAIHGYANIPGATVFPHQIGLGAANDPDLVRRVYEATAREMIATGVYWNFAPSLDVTKDHRWGRTFETFSGFGDRVTSLTAAAVTGLQGTATSSPVVLATAKHYVGAGAMVWGTSVNKNYFIDQGEVKIAEAALRLEHLPPYQAAVDAGVWSIMAGLNNWQGQKLSANKYLLTDVLKGELGFQGFIVSDWYGVYEIPGNYYQNTIVAMNAGIDLVMLPFTYESFITNFRQAMAVNRVPLSRLDDAVRRILRAKFALGLFDKPLPEPSALEVIGSEEHRDLAREAVRRSLVLLKNNGRTLPLDKEMTRIVIAGSAADNVGRQCGGWTVEWQGIDGNWLPGATSILAGIRNTVSPETEIIFEQSSEFDLSTKATIGIAIVGEKPYAEGQGDEARPRLSDEDLATIKRLRNISQRLVVVIVSGRPLDIKSEARNWDAVVAAWLPGSEGQGVSDVLFGDYEFTGTLPLPWEL